MSVSDRVDPAKDYGGRAICRLTGSALVVLGAEPLYAMWDLAVVGRLGASALAALGVGVLVLSVIGSQLTFLSYGTTARSARAFGAGDRDTAVAEGVQATWIAVSAGVVIVAFFWPLSPPLLAMLVGPGHIAADGTVWLRVAIFGVPLILVSMAGNGWMRGVQDTRRPVVFVVVGLGVSAFLCPIFVHGLLGFSSLGLVGSAWANLIGQSVAGLAFGIRVVRAARGRVVPSRPILGAQLRMSGNLVVRSASFQACFLSAAAVASRFGAPAVAAHQLVMQLWNFLSLVLDALAIAAQSLVGAALGARLVGTAKGVARRVMLYSLVASAVLAIIFASGASTFPTLFTSDVNVLDAVVTPWWFLVVMLPIAGVVFACDGVLLGGGDAAFLRTATAVAAAVVFLPTIWLSLVCGWGLTGIWSGLLAFMIARLGAQIVRTRGGRWTTIEP